MAKAAPACYRVFVFEKGKWRPVVTRTRNPDDVLAKLDANGWRRSDVLVELRPGKGIKMPKPDPKNRLGPRLADCGGLPS